MKIKKILLSLITLSVIVNPYFAYADEISVSGNGEGSTNNVNIGSDSTTQTQQSNTAEINNNVDINANTGNNSASENNGGETNITTGDVNTSSEIVNAAVNQSFVETGCCGDALALNISGNGSDSNNSIGYSSNKSTNVSIESNTNIENKVQGKANTGNNSANQNNGSVSIYTGNIKATDVIKNNSINIYEVNAKSGTGGSVYISLDGNGADSNNSVNFSNNNSVNINVNNSANIVNNSNWDLNTGGNNANQNNGDVNITTGDIVFQSTIENTDVNIGLVDVDCCEEEKGPPPDGTPPPTIPPTNNSNGGNNGGGNGGSSSGSSTGTVLGQILPITGNYSMLLFLIGNIVMFFMGGYLRLRSGRSPNYLFAR